MPVLLELPSIEAYREHFVRSLVGDAVVTRDGVRTFFRKENFFHAFYESSKRGGEKDRFSLARAKRMDWIRETLKAPEAVWFQGWIRRKRRHSATRAVVNLHDAFVVVLQFGLDRRGRLKARFVTCYDACNSIFRIHCSPLWIPTACRRELEARGIR